MRHGSKQIEKICCGFFWNALPSEFQFLLGSYYTTTSLPVFGQQGWGQNITRIHAWILIFFVFVFFLLDFCPAAVLPCNPVSETGPPLSFCQLHPSRLEAHPYLFIRGKRRGRGANVLKETGTGAPDILKVADRPLAG